MIKVEDDTHKEAKAKAKALGMTLQGLVASKGINHIHQ